LADIKKGEKMNILIIHHGLDRKQLATLDGIKMDLACQMEELKDRKGFLFWRQIKSALKLPSKADALNSDTLWYEATMLCFTTGGKELPPPIMAFLKEYRYRLRNLACLVYTARSQGVKDTLLESVIQLAGGRPLAWCEIIGDSSANAQEITAFVQKIKNLEYYSQKR
jgi:hypothetical protein